MCEGSIVKMMKKINLKKLKKIHLIGIGGIGMSGMARILLGYKIKVSGSDLTPSVVTHNLEKLGVKIYLGRHKAKNVNPDIQLVIHSLAVPKTNPEILQAKKLKIKILSYPEMLGELTQDKFSICIAGTHGKTTTTAMIASILEEAGLDPTVLIGSNLEKFRGNAKVGKSKYFVIEADEYRSAFLNYHPNIIVLTNIEYEHPDYFKNLNHVKATFTKFIQKLPKDGTLIVNADNKNAQALAKFTRGEVLTYGIKAQKPDFLGTNIEKIKGIPRFNIKWNNKVIDDLKLSIPGIHNVENALAACAVGLKLKVLPRICKFALSSYKGAWRRFELKGQVNGIVVIDDYAHHPTEIKVTLSAARDRFPKKEIICVFQPHHMLRFQKLFSDFVKSFDLVDEIIVSEIYAVAGREDKKLKLSSKDLVTKLKARGKIARYFPKFVDIVKYLVKRTERKRNIVIITMGAGDITTVANKLINKLKIKRRMLRKGKLTR